MSISSMIIEGLVTPVSDASVEVLAMGVPFGFRKGPVGRLCVLAQPVQLGVGPTVPMPQRAFNDR
jgi:hypothetical protein